MKKIIVLAVLFLASVSTTSAQDKIWWNPEHSEFPVVEGQAWPSEVESYYDRFPTRAKDNVREPVWDLSTNSAGLIIRFHTNSPDITIRYGLGMDFGGSYAMTHFPATGVSGLDLYALDQNGKEIFAAGRRAFADTSSYQYSNLDPVVDYEEKGTEYRLYLPLYNKVTWMEIGVDSTARFEFLARRDQKPIVVYGTSIAQGGCASRPGMAWTSILARDLNQPVVNLGFSGNCHMDEEVISLLGEIDAELFVIDCMPNLDNADRWADSELSLLIKNSILDLRDLKPNTPILLVDHSGYAQSLASPSSLERIRRLRRVQRSVIDQLSTEGNQKDLFYLNTERLGMSMDGTVDGVHPNDLGMMQIATGYAKRLREIIKTKNQ